MEELNRVIVLKLEVEEGKIVAIHALEIIDDIITGIFFHAFLNKNIQKYNDMYYLARYKHFDDILEIPAYYCHQNEHTTREFVKRIEKLRKM